MGSITVNDVVEGICNTLDGRFDYEVYDEAMEQGFEEPCFFVEPLNSAQKRIGYYRHKRTQTFCIHFYPFNDGRMSQSILKMTEELYFLLECIRVNGLLCRGTGMNHKSEGSMLHFFINYNYHLLEVPPDIPKMKKLNHREVLKNGRNGKRNKTGGR